MRTGMVLSAVLLFSLAAMAGDIYAVQGDVLYMADTATGEWESLSDTWSGTELLTSLGGSLYAIQGDVLYQVDRNGNWTELSDTWSGATALTAGNGRLYAVQNDVIYSVDPSDG
ncbi:MAG TPA: hypothetical protein P5207_06165, partial [Candidatus Sabulitectum sp.]|nr:hypothetical protein [Candidatus Sabulitectum sp.]